MAQVICVEPIPERRDLVRASYPQVVFGDDIDPHSDLVVVTTPDTLHVEMAHDALRRGRAVFVEKPLALDASAAKDLVDTATAMGQHLFVGFQRLWDPAVRWAAEEVRRCGPPSLVLARDVCHSNARLLESEFPDSRLSDELSPGPGPAAWPQERADVWRLFANLCCHDLSALQAILAGRGECRWAQLESREQMLATYAFGPTAVSLAAMQAAHTWFDQEVRLEWPSRSIAIAWPSPFLVWAKTRCIVRTDSGELSPTFTGNGSRFEAMWDELLTALEQPAGGDPHHSAANAVEVARLVDETLRQDLTRLAPIADVLDV